MEKKLYRSRNDKMIAGVCGGLAEYFNIDATLVRIVAAILLLASFFTLLVIYLLCAVIIPERAGEYVNQTTGESTQQSSRTISPEEQASRDHKVRQFLGIGLICLGALMFFRRFIYWFDGDFVWSVAIIAIGAVLLLTSYNKKS